MRKICLRIKIGQWRLCIANQRIRVSPQRAVISRQRHRTLKKNAIERVGERCELCGCPLDYKRAQLHHIIPLSFDASLAADPENILLLCDACHRKIHNNPFANVNLILRHYPQLTGELETLAECPD